MPQNILHFITIVLSPDKDDLLHNSFLEQQEEKYPIFPTSFFVAEAEGK